MHPKREQEGWQQFHNDHCETSKQSIGTDTPRGNRTPQVSGWFSSVRSWCLKVEMFSHYFNSSFFIHSQQVNDCCFFRSRLLATKRLISLEDSPDRPSLGVHIQRQRKTRWKRRRWPRAGSIQLQETPCQLSHCAQVNGGSSARCREGTGKQASSLSHRKIHSVHQELTLIAFLAVESAPYECLLAYSKHRLQLRQ